MADSPYKLKFSPSSSKRWLNCPGSPALVASLPQKPSGKFAMEGTAAHELAANCLQNGDDADMWLGEVIEVEGEMFKVNKNMAVAVQVYLDAVRNDLEENGLPASELAIEKKFTVEGIASVKGTNDASFSSPLGMLYVYDYKHGVGTYVDVRDNTQLKIYALGAMQEAGWVNDSVRITIAQPRYRDDTVEQVRSWDISKEELLAFKDELKAGVLACCDPHAPCKPGPWCGETFCPAFGVCPGVRKTAVEIVEPASTALTFPDPTSLTPEQMAKVLEVSELISAWTKAVRAHAEDQALNFGAKIPGYKVIAKKGNRAWIDPDLVVSEFEHEFGDEIYEKKLKSPAKMEKVVGKKDKERVAVFVDCPDKGFHLVPESSKGDSVEPEAIFQKIEKKEND